MASNTSSSSLFIAGAVGGVAECVAVQPFDMLKTRFQLSPVPNPSIWSSLQAVVKEGGFLRLYRGILPEAAGMMPKSSAMYAANELAKRTLGEWNGGINAGVAFTAGALSGYPESITVTPFQVVKVRLQAREHLGRYTNSAQCFRRVLADEGLLAFTTGMGPTCWRNCVWNGVYFGLMHEVKGALPTPATRWGDLLQSLVVGFFAGIIATGFNAPFDVVKSRFQSQLPPELNNGQPRKYRFTLPSLYTIFREEGPKAMYKGFAPKAIRMGLGGGVCMATFEAVCHFMGTENTVDTDSF